MGRITRKTVLRKEYAPLHAVLEEISYWLSADGEADYITLSREITAPTDQSKENGGDGAAPEPFQLFLASIPTCAGIYALEFCNFRGIETDGMLRTMRCEFDEKTHPCEKLNIDLKPSPGFPENYKKAMVRSTDLCTVKRRLEHPPEFVMTAN